MLDLPDTKGSSQGLKKSTLGNKQPYVIPSNVGGSFRNDHLVTKNAKQRLTRLDGTYTSLGTPTAIAVDLNII